MSSIGGKKREKLEVTEFKKFVGLFEATVVAINPSVEEFKDILNMELKEDSKQTEYLGKSKDDNQSLRIDIWLEEIKNQEKFKLVFFLENKERVSKDGLKKQYINSVGQCTWAEDPNDIPDWFSSRDYRVAFEGEENLFKFLRSWLGGLDLKDAESTLQLEWKKLMKGNVKDLRDLIGGELTTNVVALATIKTVEKEDGPKSYQGVFNKAFLPPYHIKHFRLTDYSNPAILKSIKDKKPKDLKPHERFIKDVTGEYGCPDFYVLKDLKEYDPSDNLVESDKVIADDDGSY
jgi:hypothetical protein